MASPQELDDRLRRQGLVLVWAGALGAGTPLPLEQVSTLKDLIRWEEGQPRKS